MQPPTEQEERDLKKRKLIATETWTTFHLSQGPSFSLDRKEHAIVLTAEMLQEYDFAYTILAVYLNLPASSMGFELPDQIYPVHYMSPAALLNQRYI